MKHDKLVGVLGGMGPYATVDFFAQLVRLTPAEKDWDHLHIIVDNNPRMPSRSRAYLHGEASPVPDLIAGAQRLVAAGAQLIAVPCNSAAYFLEEVRAAVPVPVLDPVAATVAVVRVEQRPLVLGGAVTHGADLYGKHLPQRVRPTDTEQDEVVALIEALKHLDTSDAVVARVEALVAAGLARGADAVILGCTEFGLIADRVADGRVPVFNSNELLARHTVALARTPATGS